jgi:O-antigen/teichoic acid export membrane protein
MNKSSLTLRPSWHLPVVFVLTFVVAGPFASLLMPQAARLQSQGHSGLAAYFNVVGVAVWFITLLILLPRRGNDSPIRIVRTLGRLNLAVRYAAAFSLATGLFWFGILLKKIFI